MAFRKAATAALLSITMLSASPASAATILIINGSSGTSEPSTTSSITTQLTNLHTAVGNTVSVSDGVPADLSGFAQVWDLRFSNVFALTSSVISQYLTFLQAGGGMFVMGENSGFVTRNNSILNLINQAGGGSLAFQTPSDAQIVYAPFDGPNAVSNINYSAPGGVNGFGSGQWITSNAGGTAGTGVAWGVGQLTNAPAGALTAIFDVNFLQTDANAGSQALAANLVRFVNVQVNNPAVPEPGTWAMMLIGFGAVGYSMRRARRVKVLPAAA